MSGLAEIAPQTGIDKDFAQFKFRDSDSSEKSRVEWAKRPAVLIVRV